MIFPRLLASSLRIYTAEPARREAAATNLLINALRLAVHHVGRKRAAELILQVFDYHKDRAA